MIGFKTIQRAIIAKLSAAVPGVEIYTNTIEKLNQEAFFIAFLPVNQRLMDDVHVNKTFRTIIRYFPDLRDKKQDRMYEVMDILHREFTALQVEDRVITVHDDAEASIVDNVLNFNIPFEFVDSLESEETSELMETLELNYELGG
jgi:hypothetical protein